MNNLSKRNTERKSRRTHKNSRDGCPNCKAKRIKCSEELPACHNCIKKNYRCGYLDFSVEKLEHLRKKNEKKLLESQQALYLPIHSHHQRIHSNETVTNPLQNFTNEPNLLIGDQNPHPIINQHSHIHQNRLLPKLPDHDTSPNQPWSQLTSKIDNQISNTQNFQAIENLNVTNIHQNTGCETNHHNYYDSSGQQSYQNIIQEPIADINSRISSQKEELVNAFIWESFNRVLDPPNTSFDPLAAPPKTTVEEIFDFNNIKLSFNNLIKPNIDISGDFDYDQQRGCIQSKILQNTDNSTVNLNPLPNAVVKRAIFPKLKIEKNEFVNHYLQINPMDLKQLTNYNFEVTYSPIWSNSEYDRIWSSVYKQAEILNIYFCFFIERSLNVLIKKYNSSIGVESFSNESLDLELSDHSISPSSSIFSSKDLILLTRISYFYYGDLIKAIRESLTKINIEYSTKISLFSSWSTFLQLHGSVETLCLMLGGTSSLFLKIVNESHVYNEITPTIRFCINLLNDHTSYCLVPDYNFSVIEDLYDDLREFKLFCYNNQDLTSAKNSLVIMNLLKLEHFLKGLINNYYPKIKRINEYYKYLNNIRDNSNNIYCISFTLLFELLVEWFDILPSELKSLSSHATPLRKTFYLFFTAIGKTLINVFSSIRTLMIVDLCDMFFPKVEMNYALYHFDQGSLTNAQYDYLSTLSVKLMRNISFFNSRLSLYAYHLANTTVLDEEYVHFYKEVSKVTEYKDTIRFVPKKLKVDEVMLENFSLEQPFKLCHYPTFDIFKQHNFPKYTSDHHVELKIDISTIDLNSGILMSDYDANPLITEYKKFTYKTWKSTGISIEDMRHRMQILHSGRNEISRGVKFNLYGESS